MTPVASPIPRIGVAVFIVHNGAVLLGKRRNAHGEGCWATPGGHLEFGETVEQCAVREVLEETGLTVHNVQTIGWTNDVFVHERKHYVTLFTVVNQFSGELEVKEKDKCDGWQWWPLNALPNNLFLSLQTFMKKVTPEQLTHFGTLP